MVNTIIIKNDDTSGNTPADNELVTGELAVNTTDGKLFYGDNNGDAQEFAMGGSNQTLTTGNGLTGANSGSSGNITFAVGAGTGIDVSSDAVAVDVSDFMTNGADNRVLTATGTDAMNAEANMTFNGTDLTLGNDLLLDSDSAVLKFGDDQDITLTHVADTGLTLTHHGTSDNLPLVLKLKSEEDTIVADETIARIDFEAGDDSGNDAILPAASIAAVAEATFGSGDNSTKLTFGLGESVSSVGRTCFSMDHDGDFHLNRDGRSIKFGDSGTQIAITHIDNTGLSTNGDFTVGDDLLLNSDSAVFSMGAGADVTITHDGSTGATLASAGDFIIDCEADITLDANGGDVKLLDGGAMYGVFTNNSGQLTIKSGATSSLVLNGADVTVQDDLTLITDASVLGFGADTDTTLTHVADTGLLLNSSRQLQFGDSGTYIHQSTNGQLDIVSDDELFLHGGDNVTARVKDTFRVQEDTNNHTFLRVHADDQTLELFHNDSSANKFKMEVAASGVTTLSTHDEDGTVGHLTLDVDGNITLDADGGTITFSDAGSSLGTITSSGYSGNAGTATTLATARNIGGVSFNGSANINLPGVNTSGNQDTTGNAATATALATARNIAGQSFDGTGNISIAPTDLTSVTATASEINVLDGFAGATADLTYAKDLRATGVTTTEFDKLDGLTASTSELNIMDGVTATTSELNIMDGVTASTSELNIMDGVTATTAELNLIDGGTARGTTAVASGDGFLHNDGGTMRMTNISKLADRLAGTNLTASDGVLSASGGGSTGNFSFSGNTLSNSNDILIDGNGDITLDANGADIVFKDDGATYGGATNNSGGLIIKSGTTSVMRYDSAGSPEIGNDGIKQIGAWIFGHSNLDNGQSTYISWSSTNSNQSNIFNHRGLMPAKGKIVEWIMKTDGGLSGNPGTPPLVIQLTGSTTSGQSDATHSDDSYRFTGAVSSAEQLGGLIGYQWEKGDTIVGTITPTAGTDQRAQSSALIEWTY